jgi:hypothetical protein
MKAAVLLMSALMVLASFSLVAAQSVTLDHADGVVDGVITPGENVTFYIRLTNGDVAQPGINNGFRVYSDEGVTWSPMVGTINPAYNWTSFFETGLLMCDWFSDGIGSDTIGFGGAAMFTPGLPAGFDDVGYWFSIGAIDEAYVGKEIVLDSSWFRPSGVWEWYIQPFGVAWGGPYTFVVGGDDPCAAGPTTYLSQDPIILKDLADRVLNVYVECEDNANVDLNSVVVQGKIPPYTVARIEGDLLVTDVFIFRFLAAWRPISSDVQSTYTVGYTVSGVPTTLTGDMNLKVYPGDLTFDGIEDGQDITYMVDYMFKRGPEPMLNEALDVNRDGEVGIRDLRDLIEIIY